MSFTQSYGASGDQARAVAAGLDADIVQLSTGLDIELLEQAGLVDPKWDRQSYKGIATVVAGRINYATVSFATNNSTSG